jgi:hypothetical protein
MPATRLSSAAAWPHAVNAWAGPAHADEYDVPFAASPSSALYCAVVSRMHTLGARRTHLHDEVAVQQRAQLRVRRRAEELVQRADPDRCEPCEQEQPACRAHTHT